MGAAKKLEIYPDEQFLADAIKDGRATRQEVSMKALGKPDVRLQAREQHLDMDHVRMLAEILEREGQLAPVVIFRTKEGKLLLADGFHRHEVYRKAGKAGIPAWVIDGDFREAIEYATMCNRRLCLARKPGDIRKAIEILLADDVWFQRADGWFASHVGCDGGTVTRVRLRFCEDRSIPIPSFLLKRNGVIQGQVLLRPRITRSVVDGIAAFVVWKGREQVGKFSCLDEAEKLRSQLSPKFPRRHLIVQKRGKHATYVAKIGGKRYYLGTKEDVAKAKLDQLWDEHLKTLAQPPADPPALPSKPVASPAPALCCPHCGHALPGWSAPK